MEVTIVSSGSLEGLLFGKDGINEKLNEGWRLYGSPFVVDKKMCEKLPEGVDLKGKRICLMMIRNLKE